MKKIISLITAGILLVCVLAGCGGDSGTVTTDGSTSMSKVINALGEAFLSDTGITVTYNATGSGAGIQAVQEGRCDIGLSSRNLKDEEKAKGLEGTILAYDGIAIIVNPNNPVSDLDVATIAKIYTGEIKNWKEVGGNDAEIVLIGREAGSGTRGAFEEILSIEEMCKYASELDSTGAVMAKVSATPGAIGYVSLDALNDTVKAVALEGVEATAENILAGNYFLSRPFVMATKGAIEEQSEVVRAFFEYVFSEDGQAVVQQVGLIPVK